MISRSTPCDWLYWFNRLDNDEEIRLAAYTPVVPIKALQTMRIEAACSKLDEAWKNVFVPGPQHVDILRTLVDQAKEFAQSNHPTLKDYNRQLSANLPPAGLQPIRCLTGLAGVSKSSLVKAFERICQLEHPGQFIAEGQRLALRPVRRVEIDGQPSTRSILKNLANPLAIASKAMSDTAALMAHLRDWFMVSGCCSLVVDEMQFFTQSSTASTKTSQVIMCLGNLGVPLIYIANYSLVRKLMLRPHEEKDRLLAAPIVLDPPNPDAPWWAAAVTEYLAVSPECFRIDVPANAGELHRLTAGLFRALRQLLLHAYREAVSTGSTFVSMREVRLAYRSRAFSCHRKDIEDLASLAVSRLMEEKRFDLTCPFAEIKDATIATRTLKPAWPQQLTATASPIGSQNFLLESTLSVDEQACVDVLRQAANRKPEERITAKVTRLPRRTAVSAQSLIQGAQLLRNGLSTSRSKSKAENTSTSPLEPDDEKTN